MLAIHVDKVKMQKGLIKTSVRSSTNINIHNQGIFTYDCTTIYLSYYNLYSVIFFMKMSREMHDGQECFAWNPGLPRYLPRGNVH